MHLVALPGQRRALSRPGGGKLFRQISGGAVGSAETVPEGEILAEVVPAIPVMHRVAPRMVGEVKRSPTNSIMDQDGPNGDESDQAMVEPDVERKQKRA